MTPTLHPRGNWWAAPLPWPRLLCLCLESRCRPRCSPSRLPGRSAAINTCFMEYMLLSIFFWYMKGFNSICKTNTFFRKKKALKLHFPPTSSCFYRDWCWSHLNYLLKVSAIGTPAHCWSTEWQQHKVCGTASMWNADNRHCVCGSLLWNSFNFFVFKNCHGKMLGERFQEVKQESFFQ